MIIKNTIWEKYIADLRQIREEAADKMAAFFMAIPEPKSFEGRNALIDYAVSLIEFYGAAAAAEACDMYDHMAEESNASVPAAEPADLPAINEVAKVINGALKDKDPYEVPKAVDRLVKQVGVDTTLYNAIRDGAEHAWVPHGETCAFCLMLASRGWEESTDKSLKNGHAEHLHPNCDCTYAIRFDGQTEVEGYDPEALREKWDSLEGSNSKEKLKNWRKEIQEENRETRNWIKSAENNDAEVIKNVSEVNINGITYKVDNVNVIIDHTKEEISTAELLSMATGEQVILCPRITGKFKKVSTPDFFVGERLAHWDRKGLKGSGPDALRDAIKRKKKQADNFIIDISNWQGGDDNIIDQAKKIFEYPNTNFVNSVALVRGDEIVYVKNR